MMPEKRRDRAPPETPRSMRHRGPGYSVLRMPDRVRSVLPNSVLAESLPRSIDLSAPGSVEPRAPARPARQERIPLGIFYMIGATAMFAGSSAVSKLLVVTYSVDEVLFSRCAVGLICCAIFILPRTGLKVFRTNKLRSHLARSVSQSFSQTFILIAFSLMPLASAVAINFSAPLFATLISAVVLRETVGVVRWSVLIVGFLGVLLVAGPGADTFQIGSLFALANAVLYGSVTVGVRHMTSTESTETLTFYQLLFLTLFFAIPLPFGFLMPTWTDGAVMVFNGLANVLGQYWWTRSLHLAPTSAVVPFNYFSLVWVLIIGFLVWGDVPTLHLLVGSGVVVGSGLFLLWRETRR
jgi:drug/metabolite transporter (DMT)-like permease